MRQRGVAAIRVLGLLAVTGAVTFGLHQLGRKPWLAVDWSDLERWLETTPPEDALLSAVRLVGLGCGWWILVSTCFYLGASALGATNALRIASPLTLPVIRNLSARVVLGAVTLSSMGNPVPALAASEPPTPTALVQAQPIPAPFHRSPPLAFRSAEPVLQTTPMPFPGFNLTRPAASEPESRPEPPIPPAASQIEPMPHGTEYRVVAGDHLWSIARRVVAQSHSGSPTEHQTASYWVDLIEANRNTLRSGDPDLIFPGELIVLPPLPNG